MKPTLKLTYYLTPTGNIGACAILEQLTLTVGLDSDIWLYIHTTEQSNSATEDCKSVCQVEKKML